MEAACRFGFTATHLSLIDKRYNTESPDKHMVGNSTHLNMEDHNILIEYIALLNSRNKNGDAPIHIACGYHNLGAVKQLLKSGYDINATNLRGNTGLHISAFLNDSSITEYLIEMGADVNHQNARGNTALHLAYQQGHCSIIDRLVEGGSSFDIQNHDGRRPFNMRKNPKSSNDEDTLDQVEDYLIP
jgi:ankyrin repeat protein